MRILPDSPAVPGAPMSMLLFPVVRLTPALLPRAILFVPVVLAESAPKPVAVFSAPVVLAWSAESPSAGFAVAVGPGKKGFRPGGVVFFAGPFYGDSNRP